MTFLSVFTHSHSQLIFKTFMIVFSEAKCFQELLQLFSLPQRAVLESQNITTTVHSEH